MSLISKIFGDANKRYLGTLAAPVDAINQHEKEIAELSESALKEKTLAFKQRIQESFKRLEKDIDALGELIRKTVSDDEKNRLKKQLIELHNQPLNEILPEAFAVVRETARRTLGQRHFNVQLMGGIVLHEGQVAEMKTGEGKTLTATLSIYLNALVGKGVHIVTVNDYLARRDAVWMGQIFNFLGLSVGVIIHDTAFLYDPSVATAEQDQVRDQGVTVEMEFLRPVDRKTSYAADITYGTNNEFGFDYLRDNMVLSLDQKVQRELYYAIIDEVDSILIDEARTPLIISAPDMQSTDRYYQFAKLVESLEENKDYNVDEKLRAATLTENGIAGIEKILGVDNIYVEKGIQTVHHIEQALKAKTLFKRDRDYTVKDGQVIIVDEFTGRLLQGRRYSEGLHQAIEAKEGLAIQRESKTMATITFQNYFRLYHKLAGMTGTAETEAEELAKIYNLEVTVVPTNKPMIRKDQADRVYKTYEGKLQAVVEDIKRRHALGQPILVGTISIEKNELLGSLLEREGLQFNILNAKQHEREAEIIAQAGAAGAITVATNMAGRGVDIKLGGSPFNEERFRHIVTLGGLHVLGTERHESRRIDNQLRGRSGRQGEPGSSQFFVSLEDDLMRIFGADRIKGMMKSWPDDMPIENAFISKSIESAQKRVEGHNFDIRKHLVEYDDVINKQRSYVYGHRNQILGFESNKEEIVKLAEDELAHEIEESLAVHTAGTRSNWNVTEIVETSRAMLGITEGEKAGIKALIESKSDEAKIITDLTDRLVSRGKEKLRSIIAHINVHLKSATNEAPAYDVIRSLYVRSIDLLWVDHLETINYLRTGIGLRGYGQRDPLVEYKRESKELFNRMLSDTRRQFVYSVLNIAVGTPTPVSSEQTPRIMQEQKATLQAFSGKEQSNAQAVTAKPKNAQGRKIGRNDPCFCGAVNPESGQPYKYKKCGLINAPYHKE